VERPPPAFLKPPVLWHLPVLLWLRLQGAMAGGFLVPWIEVTALSALVA
jgi:hypothetical protein